MAHITFDQLAQVFHLPLVEAASFFGIGSTALKRACRKNKISRWPFRRLKSLDKMISTLESERARTTDRNELMKISVELEYLQYQQKAIMHNPDVEDLPRPRLLGAEPPAPQLQPQLQAEAGYGPVRHTPQGHRASPYSHPPMSSHIYLAPAATQHFVYSCPQPQPPATEYRSAQYDDASATETLSMFASMVGPSSMEVPTNVLTGVPKYSYTNSSNMTLSPTAAFRVPSPPAPQSKPSSPTSTYPRQTSQVHFQDPQSPATFSTTSAVLQQKRRPQESFGPKAIQTPSSTQALQRAVQELLLPELVLDNVTHEQKLAVMEPV